MLLVSVTATAGIFVFLQNSLIFFSGIAPSNSEYSEWRRKWMNRGSFFMDHIKHKEIPSERETVYIKDL